ncbi:MAG: right-handed parallel beta-helix repeat-containing protein [Clostridia bacterium]
MTIDGNVYGVIPDDQPLGGGYGYKEIFTTGDYIVETAAELRAALAKARKGEVVFVKGDAVIDLSAEKSSMIINDGVTLASDRGNGNSTGALIYSDSLISPLFTAGENVRITGLTFRGADPERRIEFHRRAFYVENAPGSTYYYKLKTLDCITTTKNKLHVDNCEFSGFSHAAIYVSGGLDHYFHHNYIHHNQRQGLGYGISHGTATSVIEYNLFNANRHDIAGTGAPGSGYIARHNIQMGTSLSHCFDMHGGADRNDGTDIAGDTILMYNNVFLSDQLPYAMRGTPQTVQRFYRNIVWPSLESLNQGRLYGRNEREKEKVEMTDNVFNAGIEPTVVP